MPSSHSAWPGAATGFFLGLVLGPISLLCVYVRNSDGREDRPELTGKLIAAFLVTSLPSALNGAIGAYTSSRTGTKRLAVVAYLPAALHLLVLVLAGAFEPQSAMGFQHYTLLFTVVAWIAGRSGQEVGCWLYRHSQASVEQDHRSHEGGITSSRS